MSRSRASTEAGRGHAAQSAFSSRTASSSAAPGRDPNERAIAVVAFVTTAGDDCRRAPAESAQGDPRGSADVEPPVAVGRVGAAVEPVEIAPALVGGGEP